jgi:predicted pyridoxine 5'-phosphate oxidase superfamily flavin-nucleotide-binding protein
MGSLPLDPHVAAIEAALGTLCAACSALLRAKVARRLGPPTRAFVALSPFVLLATVGPDGPHDPPRGDAPAFVEAPDDRTLMRPDRRGNNRLDALRDILHAARATRLCVAPGAGGVLRVHGRARITTEPALRAPRGGRPRAGDAPRRRGREPVHAVRQGLPPLPAAGGVLAARGAPTLGRLVAEQTAGAHGGEALDGRMPEMHRHTLC